MTVISHRIAASLDRSGPCWPTLLARQVTFLQRGRIGSQAFQRCRHQTSHVHQWNASIFVHSCQQGSFHLSCKGELSWRISLANSPGWKQLSPAIKLMNK